ncbi:long-chain-fatty-acid--CoA ligase [Naegleria gruberi]|uniref:Long-chain-fatty-acid--CoA ligase n=1 Tax=Naegleria gruberi TaxID=5762 RepID=D2W4D7_NAEGR|nr:long-chain-fatty-acid--CoA ligase [Naegleria gruberi]EFC36057.1 long-chain-fatty-acid--CoA ligase [Naegleria gruberi]|eukprot:XP_002668801.1 long-chain-fatty-acid--CoA ligase [Naegleria gruberi strain NEG-M]
MVFEARIDLPTIELNSKLSLAEFIIEKCREHGDNIAMIDGTSPDPNLPNCTLTYNQMADNMLTIGNNLIDQFNIKKGNVIAMILPNIPLFPCIFHGIGYTGGIITTLNPLYSVEEINNQLKDSNACMMFTLQTFLEKTILACKGTNVKNIFVLNYQPSDQFNNLLNENDLIKLIDAKILLAKQNVEMRKIDINPLEDLIALPYSSGTTGLSKGVCLTHYNLISNVLQIGAKYEKLTKNDVIVALLPFFHIYGMTVLCNLALYEGSKAITMARFDLETFLKIVQNYQVTRTHLAPPIILALAKHPIIDKYNLTSMKYCLSGAAPLSSDVSQLLSNRLGVIVKQGYGMTESSPVVSVCGDTSDLIKDGSSGLLVNNTKLKIIDTETGNEITEYGQVGELCFSGPQIMKGYLNNEQATKSTLIDGYLHTGDLGYIDQDGFIFIVDRLKELIKYKGIQVPPCQLEGILCKHPKILDSAVIGVPDEEAGELPKAFVVLRPNEIMTEEEVMEFVSQFVTPQKKIRLVEFIQEIPKSTAGKILRRILKQRELEKLKNIQ